MRKTNRQHLRNQDFVAAAQDFRRRGYSAPQIRQKLKDMFELDSPVCLTTVYKAINYGQIQKNTESDIDSKLTD